MIMTKEIFIPLDAEGPFEHIKAQQCSSDSLIVKVVLLYKNRPVILDKDMIPQVVYQKPDGKKVVNDCEVEGQYIIVKYTKQMLIAAGTAKAQIYYSEDNQEIVSSAWYTDIYPTVGGQIEESSDEYITLSNFVKKASNSATAAANSATLASESASEAANSATSASSSANAAAGSATSASESATAAANSATSASDSASEAAGSAEEAATQASNASNSASQAATQASNASNSAKSAANSATSASSSASEAEYYYNQAKSISESFASALRPMGTVTFSTLLSIPNATEGDMYNVSEQFTTTSAFKEGAGKVIPAGSNVYKTHDGYWDVLAGSPVTGVKGSGETTYRTGNVNLTPANIGLGNVNNTSDKDKPISTATQAALDELNSNLELLQDDIATKGGAATCSMAGLRTETNVLNFSASDTIVYNLSQKPKSPYAVFVQQASTGGGAYLEYAQCNDAGGVTLKMNKMSGNVRFIFMYLV